MRVTCLHLFLTVTILSSVAAPVPALSKTTACRDCPFPMTLQCKPGNSDEPGSLICRITKPHKASLLKSVKVLHCDGGEDTPVPLKCSVQFK
jgi:hypothetical protein